MSEKKYLLTNEDLHEWCRIGCVIECSCSDRMIALEEFKKAHEFTERTCNNDGNGVFRCSACGAFVKYGAVMDCCTTIPMSYCPNCGAKVIA